MGQAVRTNTRTTTKASTIGDEFNQHFPEKPTKEQQAESNIWWRILLYWIPPRDERFDFTRDFGMQNVVAIMEGKPLKFSIQENYKGSPIVQMLTLYFPERWLSTQEEHIFETTLRQHPDIRNCTMNIINIATKSPMIISGRRKEDIRVVKAVN